MVGHAADAMGMGSNTGSGMGSGMGGGGKGTTGHHHGGGLSDMAGQAADAMGVGGNSGGMGGGGYTSSGMGGSGYGSSGTGMLGSPGQHHEQHKGGGGIVGAVTRAVENVVTCGAAGKHTSDKVEGTGRYYVHAGCGGRVWRQGGSWQGNSFDSLPGG